MADTTRYNAHGGEHRARYSSHLNGKVFNHNKDGIIGEATAITTQDLTESVGSRLYQITLMKSGKKRHTDRSESGSNDAALDDSLLADKILEQIETPIVVLDGQGCILLFNAACRTLTGYDRSEAVGRHVWDFLILPEEVDSVRKIFDETNSGDLPTHFVNYWVTKGGGTRLLKWSNFRTRLIRGGEQHILGIGIDITDMTAAEDALADREAHLRSIIQTAPDSVITIDDAGLVLSFSPAAESVFGYEAKEVVGKNVNMLMPEPYSSEHDSYLKRYRETGESHIIGEKRIISARRKDGTIFPIRLSVGEFLQHDRRYFVGFIEDISLEEDAVQRLKEMKANLDRYSRISTLGEMTTGIAHELNQPLTAAAAFAETADLLLEKEGRAPGDSVRREIKRTLTEIHRTAEIIRNIREFIRKGSPDLKLQDVNDLVKDSLTLAMVGPTPADLETEIRLAPDLPLVEFDRVQLQQVMVNLIRNALETMGGSAVQCLGISTGLRGNSVEIHVTDSGPGIDPAMEGRLFEPFATNKRDGMGLGLAIARTIVEEHQGKLTVAVNQPQGAIFTVRLPGGRRGNHE